MKMSFSLSSLHPSSHSLERAEHARMRVDRPYNSLTKKRKEPVQEHHRNWSGSEDCKDDFWAAIRSNYDYIMDTNLIDSCKDANGELAWDEGDVSTIAWGLKEVSCQFSELYSWLRVLQELVYSKEENILDKSLRAAHTEELRRKAYRRRLFNEQAEKLVARAPTLKDEVSWRVDHLNAKWDLVEQIMTPIARPEQEDQDVSADFEHEVKCLRKWLREMETRLLPLSFRVDWSMTELEEKATAHMVLQKDIEAHGRIVSSVVKLGERVANRNLTERQENPGSQSQEDEKQQDQALRVASSLERRWHLLFLRALEWQYHIEALASRVRNKSLTSSRCSSDSDDEEPVSKQPRLCRRPSRDSEKGFNCQKRITRPTGRYRRARAFGSGLASSDPGTCRSDLSDSDVSSTNRFIDDGFYLEDDLEEFCVMDVNSDSFETEKSVERRSRAIFGDQGVEGDVEEGGFSEEEDTKYIIKNMPPTPDPVPITTTTSIDDSCDEIDAGHGTVHVESTGLSRSQDNGSPKRRKTVADEAAVFNTSNRKSKNCATFYFKHADTDSEADCVGVTEECVNTVDDSSEEEWTYTATSADGSSTKQQRKTNVKVRLDFGETGKDKKEPISTEDVGGSAEAKVEQSECLKASGKECGNDKDSIQELIREAEKLVREEGRSRKLPPLIFEDKGAAQSHRAKYARIKEWLALDSVRCRDGRCTTQYCLLSAPERFDSCDASGEYTTGESDAEKQSDSSEDLQSSVATCRRLDNHLGYASKSNSQEIFDSPDSLTPSDCKQPHFIETSTPKVVMRSKRKNSGPRPWSVSCITQITNRVNLQEGNDSISQFSISETALHQLVSALPTKSISLDATGLRVPFNNSTSTLLEEAIIGHDARVARNSMLRRRKNRMRKKNAGRKSESGSDGMNGNNNSGGSDGSLSHPRSARKSSSSRPTRIVPRDYYSRSNLLVKSGSFSGSAANPESNTERTTVSDPAPQMRYSRGRYGTSETEEEERPCLHGYSNCEGNLLDSVLSSKQLHNGQFNADSDIEKISLGNNSFSEQAWDNYQEKYMSEPYSETADVETARRLLDFGDDYRNFLDSQSDCASSLSAVHYKGTVTSDSDSESEDIKKLADTSRNQLLLSESCFATMVDEEFAELSRVCRENIRCLRALSDAGGASRRGDKHRKLIRGLMERWELLLTRTDEAQKISSIHCEMAAMNLEFRAAHDRLIAYEVVLEEPSVLEERINKITSELSALRERKAAMLALNVSTHRLITDLGQKGSPAFVALKDGIADLYRIWDEAFQQGNQQLCALQAVQQFGARLTELQCALRRDKDTLAVLDAALQNGATVEVASSVRDVARLLSEKHEVNNSSQNESTLNDTLMDEKTSSTVKFGETTIIGIEGGSLSDSGISDSGSEQELSERERRLAALRRLTRTLESQLVPGSDALTELWKRVEDAEAELRTLQKQCRELIVRTAASVESRSNSRNTSQVNFPANSKRKKLPPGELDPDQKATKSAMSKHGGFTATDDPDNDPDVSKSWVWRILRAALPFQLALVVLLCAACLLEPHCCEAANSLNLSLTPQLRYVRGPPPV